MHSPLEQYVDTLGQELKALPIHERLEQMDEARAHLDGLSVAYQELGHTTEEAEQHAIVQFGEAVAVAKALNRTAVKQRWCHAAGVAAIYWGIQQFLWSGCYTLFLPYPHSGPKGWMPLYYTVLPFLTHLAAGAILKRLVPGNTLRPLLLVTGVMATIMLFLSLRLGLQWLQTGTGFTPGLEWFLPVIAPFLTSGALREARYEQQRRRRILA